MLVNFTGIDFFTYKTQPTVLFADFNSDGADYLYEVCKGFLVESKVPFDQKPFKNISPCVGSSLSKIWSFLKKRSPYRIRN